MPVKRDVLILVLLEVAFGASYIGIFLMLQFHVLILVLLEVAFGALAKVLMEIFPEGLNPCFVGSCFRSEQECLRKVRKPLSLNPCFVGSCFRSHLEGCQEDRLRRVLILVLLEVAFGGKSKLALDRMAKCLNPCFVGSCFRRQFQAYSWTPKKSLNPCFVGSCFRRCNCHN